MSGVLGIGATIEVYCAGAIGERHRWQKAVVLDAAPTRIEYRYADDTTGVLAVGPAGHVLDVLGKKWRWPRS